MSKTQISIYDPYGNKMSGYAIDGKAYLSDGSRIPTGYTAETKGGLFTMGQDGKGVKVDSIPRKEYTPSNTGSSNSLPNVNQGRYSGNIDALIGALAQGMNQGPDYNEMFEMIMGSMPKYELPPTMSQDEARRLAREQIDPVFDKGMEKSLEQVNKNSLRSGFFGQLPTVDQKGRIAGELEHDRASALAQLSNQLVGQSKQDAYTQANFMRTQQQDQLNTLLSALQLSGQQGQMRNQNIGNLIGLLTGLDDSNWQKGFQERQYQDSRQDVAWNKGVTEAQITGMFKGQPTMALTQLTHTMGMDNKKMEMMERELNHNIQMSWERLKNDKVALGQASQRIGLQSQQQALDYQRFLVGTKETAFNMTMQELARTGKAQQSDDGLSWLLGDDGYGKPLVSEKEISEMMNSYTMFLLSTDNLSLDYFRGLIK